MQCSILYLAVQNNVGTERWGDSASPYRQCELTSKVQGSLFEHLQDMDHLQEVTDRVTPHLKRNEHKSSPDSIMRALGFVDCARRWLAGTLRFQTATPIVLHNCVARTYLLQAWVGGRTRRWRTCQWESGEESERNTKRLPHVISLNAARIRYPVRRWGREAGAHIHCASTWDRDIQQISTLRLDHLFILEKSTPLRHFLPPPLP